MTIEPKSSLPSWWVALLALVVSILTSLITFSYTSGQRAEAERQQDEKLATLLTWKARTEQREQERLYEYEKQKAAKYAEMEEQIERLKNMPAPR